MSTNTEPTMPELLAGTTAWPGGPTLVAVVEYVRDHGGTFQEAADALMVDRTPRAVPNM